MVKRSTELTVNRGKFIVENDGKETELRIIQETGQFGEETTLRLNLNAKELDELIEILEEHKPKKKMKV